MAGGRDDRGAVTGSAGTDEAVLAALRRSWGQDFRVSRESDGAWAAVPVDGSGVLRAGSAVRLGVLMAAEVERKSGLDEVSALAELGPGERALRQLAEDGII